MYKEYARNFPKEVTNTRNHNKQEPAKTKRNKNK